MKQKLFQRDFTMVVIGQIVSLFGNNILRYALPLYLLNQTHSPALFGMVSACAFLPMILLCPIGGLVADRVNKRNIMVVLDFSTAALMGAYMLLYQVAALLPLLVTVMMLLYGIQGAYQPAVQASIPVLVPGDKLMGGNAVISMVNSLSGMIGPALGGVLYAAWGLRPVLGLSVLCFFASAVMEIFIRIPFKKQKHESSVLKTAAADMKSSLSFIRTGRPEVGQGSLILAGINLVFSSLIIIGLPVIVNQLLGFDEDTAKRLCGYAQAALAAGELLGALLAGTFGRRLGISRASVILLLCSLTLLPIGGVLLAGMQGMSAYLVIAACCVIMMMLSGLLTVQLMTYVQAITPSGLIGKVMALISCVCMCALPLGNAIYGALFEGLASYAGGTGWLFFGAFVLCLGLCRAAKKVFNVDDLPEPEAA